MGKSSWGANEHFDAGQPFDGKYLATISTSYPLHAMNGIREALSVGGPTFIHCLNPRPKVWDYAFELGQLAVNTGIWPLYEVECGELRLYYGKTEQIARGRFKRLPICDYLLQQGRFAHFREEDIEFSEQSGRGVESRVSSGSDRSREGV